MKALLFRVCFRFAGRSLLNPATKAISCAVLFFSCATAAALPDEIGLDHLARFSPITGIPAEITLTSSDPGVESIYINLELDRDRPIRVPMKRSSSIADPEKRFELSFPTPRTEAVYRFELSGSGGVKYSQLYRAAAPCVLTGKALAGPNPPSDRGGSEHHRNLSIEAAIYRAAADSARRALQQGLEYDSGAQALKPVDPPEINGTQGENDAVQNRRERDSRSIPQRPLSLHQPPELLCLPPWQLSPMETKAEILKLQGERDQLRRALVNLLPESALDYLSSLEQRCGLNNAGRSRLSADLSAEELALRLGKIVLALSACSGCCSAAGCSTGADPLKH